ncbi:MAG: energy-coupled thiamine transporter ThiT [Clostridiales bacterium]|jgi:thiamine transporter|nr:energy-coupled thiamine transporter ThiT [Clostridiales bacterium]
MKFTLFTELAALPIVTVLTLIFLGVLAAALSAALVYAYRSKQNDIRVKQGGPRALVYGALCVSLSFLLSYIKFFEMPQGGSITLGAMLPIALFANRFGLRDGLLAAFACGVLQFFQEPIAVHWLSPALDYVLAFTCFGLAALFPKSLPIGILVGGIGRILCSTISGALFFAEYAPAGMNPWIYSAIYNTLALGPDAAICMIVAALPPVKRAFALLVPLKGEQTRAAATLPN